jgi:hypothetical protein
MSKNTKANHPQTINIIIKSEGQAGKVGPVLGWVPVGERKGKKKG